MYKKKNEQLQKSVYLHALWQAHDVPRDSNLPGVGVTGMSPFNLSI